MKILDSAVQLFDRHVDVGPSHGNKRLHLRGLLGTLLAAAFEPAARSLRLIDDFGLHDKVREFSGVDRAARSTLSDALAEFDPEPMRPLIAALRQQLMLLELERYDRETTTVNPSSNLTHPSFPISAHVTPCCANG